MKYVNYIPETAKQNNPKGIFEISSAKMTIKTTDFADIISSTQKLKTSDLDKLKTKEEKVSFFGNLQNLMFIHMCLYLIEDSTARKVCGNETSCQMSLFFHFPSFIEAFKLNTLKRNII